MKNVSTPERNAGLSAELELVFITMLTLVVSCLTLSTKLGINVNKTVGGWNMRKNQMISGHWIVIFLNRRINVNKKFNKWNRKMIKENNCIYKRYWFLWNLKSIFWTTKRIKRSWLKIMISDYNQTDDKK